MSPPAEFVLANDVGQQAQEPRALDGAGKLTLLLRGHRGDAARHDLAALGDVTHQQLGVLVVDLRSIRARERAALAATEKRAACTRFSPLFLLPIRRGGGGGFSVFTRTARTAVTAEAATFTIATTETTLAVATEATAFAIATESAATVVTLAVTVGLAHHRGRAFLELLDADAEIADHVFADALLALDLGDRRGRCVDVEQHEMRLAFLVHAVGEGGHPPILGLGALAAETFDDAGHLRSQLFDLLRARVLAREKNMLIESHGSPFLMLAHRPASSP